jgi:hypothetical protein
MVSRLMICGVVAKLRAPCESTRKVMLLGACGYRGLWSWSIVELHWCVISVNISLETISMLFVKWSSNIYYLCWIKRPYPFHVWSLFLDFDGDFKHTSSLYVLFVKVKPWSFLVLENSWLALKMEIDFPSCWDFIHVFPNQVCSFRMEETDEQPDQMDFYPRGCIWFCLGKIAHLSLAQQTQIVQCHQKKANCTRRTLCVLLADIFSIGGHL